jgi:hypothetical protein
MHKATADGHREQDCREEASRAQATDEQQHITRRAVAIRIQSHRALLFCTDNAEPRRRVPRCGLDSQRTAAIKSSIIFPQLLGAAKSSDSPFDLRATRSAGR